MTDEGRNDTPETTEVGSQELVDEERPGATRSAPLINDAWPDPLKRPFATICPSAQAHGPGYPRALSSLLVCADAVTTVDFLERSLPPCRGPKDDRNGHQSNVQTDLRSREGAEKGKGVYAAAPACSVTKVTTQ